MSLLINDSSIYLTTKQKVFINKIFEKLKSCENYWVRRSYLITIANRGLLSNFQIQLIEFEIALFFHNLEDAAVIVEQIFPSPDPSYTHMVKKFITNFLALLIDSSKTNESNLIDKIPVESYLNMHLYVYYDQLNTKFKALSLYFKIAVSNSKTLPLIAMKIWENYLFIVNEKIEQKLNFSIASNITYNYSMLNESELNNETAPSHLLPYDFIFFYLAQPLINENFGDLTEEIVLQIYHRLLSCTFYDSLNRITEDFYYCGFDKNSIDINLLQRNKFWNICASFITAIYQRFGGTETNAKLRRGVTKILETHLEMKFLSFVNLAEDLTTPANYSRDHNADDIFDIQKDIEIFRFLICFALVKLRKKNLIECHVLNSSKNFYTFVPSHFTNISINSLKEFWLNEDETEDISEEEKVNEIDPGEIDTSLTTTVIKGESTSLINSFRILYFFGKCEISKVISSLFDIIVGSSSAEILAEIQIVSTFLQAQMFFANYEYVIQNFSLYEKMALGVLEKQVMRLQFLQIYFAQNRFETLRQIRNRKLSVEYESSLKINEFNRIFEFVVEQCSYKKFLATSDDNSLPYEFFNTTEVNCYILIDEKYLKTYSVICLINIIWHKLLLFLTASQNTDITGKVQKLDFSEKIGFIIGFLLCLTQLIWDETVGYMLFQNILDHIIRQGELKCKGLIKYLNNSVLLNHIFSLDDNVKLDILPKNYSTKNINSGQEFTKLFLDGSLILTNNKAIENLKTFYIDYKSLINEIFV